MKKFLAFFFLLSAAGWAVYVYGNSRPADAKFGPDVNYQPDQQLHEFVLKLQTMQTRMRQQVDLLEHSEKKQAATPPPDLPSNPFRDPFSPGF